MILLPVRELDSVLLRGIAGAEDLLELLARLCEEEGRHVERVLELGRCHEKQAQGKE